MTQSDIADRMAIAVVDLFEMIRVYHPDTEQRVVALASLLNLNEVGFDAIAHGKPG